ncbi:hypothetical protein ACH5RR_029614, partial [Cinchona calisaya]
CHSSSVVTGCSSSSTIFYGNFPTGRAFGSMAWPPSTPFLLLQQMDQLLDLQLASISWLVFLVFWLVGTSALSARLLPSVASSLA